MEQINLFNYPEYKINKPVRLIELFAGIGAQAKALERLGVNFEHYRVCEFDKFAIKSYNAIHGTDFETSDITKISAEDLGIVDTDKYCYIMTYSFPCQDLSVAGKQKGMSRNSNTRSGLLWQVERLLKECSELPQILVMENVLQVHGKKNVNSFNEWIGFLESKGYSNYWKDLNSKNFGVPQNRNRCFMVSILGEYSYNFPNEIPLNKILFDLLENETDVDIKYYVSDAKIECMRNAKFSRAGYKQRVIKQNDKISHTLCARDYKGPMCIEIGKLCGSKYDRQLDVNRRVYSVDGCCPTLTTCEGGGIEKKIGYCGGNTGDSDVIVRMLTPREYWRLMDFDDTDFDKAQSVVSNSQLYKQAGNSIVVSVLYYIFKELF